jgi:NAD-dependent oxidoreductase involved in siderophore biosynthesis
MLIGHLALTIAALFTGAAFYVNFAEQPARLGLKDRPLLTEWKPSYKRGLIMQATLALAGFVLGSVAWWQTSEPAFLVGALLMLAPWPWTLLVIMPTNKALMATKLAKAGPQTRALIMKWNRLHAMRTALGALSVISFLFAVSAD